MKILITGATGFIGKQLVQELVKKHKITCFVRERSNRESLEKYNVQFSEGDIMDKESLVRATKGVGCVVHLATSHMQGSELINLEGSKNIVAACKENDVKKLIFISSMAVKRKSLDDYGKTKLEIENLVKSSGLNYTILRPTVIYSKDNLSLIGKSLKSLPLIIPVIGNGKYKLNPVYIMDVVMSIKAAVENKISDKKTYDVGGAENMSYNDIIRLCKHQFKIKKIVLHLPLSLCLVLFRIFPVISLEAAKGINEDTNADITNLKKDLKINPISFEEGIKNVTL